MCGHNLMKWSEENLEMYFNPIYNELVIYSLMAVVSVVGNVLTCLVIVRSKEMHTAINCYLFNLAVADLTILLVIYPPCLSYLHSSDTRLGCQLLG